jgi:DNA-binding transcriptional MerR regulator
MNPPPEYDDSELPIFDPESQKNYSLEVVAEITGISSQTILHYQEQGLLRQSEFDDEAVHTLRRIEHLRHDFEANLSGLKLILDLMEEVDRLKQALRARR